MNCSRLFSSGLSMNVRGRGAEAKKVGKQAPVLSVKNDDEHRDEDCSRNQET